MYKRQLFADAHELATYYSALTIVSLVNCVQSGTVHIAFFAAVASMRSAVRGAMPELRRARHTADIRVQAASLGVHQSELEMLDARRFGDGNSEHNVQNTACQR